MPTATELSTMFGLMRTMVANMPAGPNGRRAEIPADAMPSEAQLARMLDAMGRGETHLRCATWPPAKLDVRLVQCRLTPIWP
jgi:hypothetical protein